VAATLFLGDARDHLSQGGSRGLRYNIHQRPCIHPEPFFDGEAITPKHLTRDNQGRKPGAQAEEARGDKRRSLVPIRERAHLQQPQQDQCALLDRVEVRERFRGEPL